MRRKRQQLSETETVSLLEKATSGVLALTGEDGYPYAVPLSYVLHAGNLYFHSARQGHKIDALLNDERASFCVIAEDRIVSSEYTTYYRSAIAFGRLRIVTDPAKKRQALEWLAAKYAPEEHGLGREIEKGFAHLFILEFAIEHLTGKAAIELIDQPKE